MQHTFQNVDSGDKLKFGFTTTYTEKTKDLQILFPQLQEKVISITQGNYKD